MTVDMKLVENSNLGDRENLHQKSNNTQKTKNKNKKSNNRELVGVEVTGECPLSKQEPHKTGSGGTHL